MDEKKLRECYPAIRVFLATDCKTQRGIETLKNELRTLLRDWEEVRQGFPRELWDVKEGLTKCEKHSSAVCGLSAPLRRTRDCRSRKAGAVARRIFHNLGLILHYSDYARLRNTIVLKPQWLITSVYALLRLKDRPDADATFSVSEAEEALPREPHETVQYLIDLMHRFEFCYPIDERETRWLVPEALDKVPSKVGLEWNVRDATRFQYGYSVLPEGLLARFIVRTNPLSEGEPRWRNGDGAATQRRGPLWCGPNRSRQSRERSSHWQLDRALIASRQAGAQPL